MDCMQDSTQSFKPSKFSFDSYVRMATPVLSSSMESGISSESRPQSFYGADTVASSHSSSQTPWSSFDSLPPSITGGQVSADHYRILYARLNAAQSENAKLLRRAETLEIRIATLKDAYDGLLSRVPQASAVVQGPTALQPLNREDYPCIEFWHRQDWTSANSERITDIEAPQVQRGRSRSAQGINVAMQYIQQEDGATIDGYRAAEMRRYARSIWVGLARNGDLFGSWGEADHNSLKLYYAEMATRFPELRLCSLDWKADSIATDNFPSWRNAWKKKAKNEDMLEEGGNCDLPSKRAPEDSTNASYDHKRLRVGAAPTPSKQSLEVEAGFQRPIINIIPGTPAKPQHPECMEICSDNLVADPSLRPVGAQVAFSINNPLASTLQTMYSFPNPVLPPAVQNFDSQSEIVDPGPKVRKPSRMRPGKSHTPRNLCAVEWVKANPKGTTDAFAAYFDALAPEELAEWTKAASATKSSPAS